MLQNISHNHSSTFVNLKYAKYRMVQKRTVLRVNNFVTVNGRKVCDMSNVSEFCLIKVENLHDRRSAQHKTA